MNQMNNKTAVRHDNTVFRMETMERKALDI
jgi:hypothetical protein